MLFILVIDGCNQLDKNYFNLKNHMFFETIMPLPGNYVQTNVDSLIAIWRYSDLSSDVIERKINFFELLKSKLNSDYVIFADTADVSNTVLVVKGPFIKLSKWTSKEFYLILDKKLRAEAKEMGVGFTPIENSYRSFTNGISFIKVQFELNSEGSISYATQYLVNTANRTIGISVYSKDDDFEEMIRRVKPYAE